MRYLLFLVAAAGIAAAVQLSSTAGRVSPVIPPPSAPAPKPAESAIGAAGIVEAVRENTAVGVPVPALVKSVEVKVWDKVESGAPLLRLDDTEVRASLLSLRAAALAAAAEVKLAAAEHARVLASLDKWNAVATPGAVSPDELALKRGEAAVAAARLDAARATLNAAEARVAEAEALAARLVVRAPISGTVLQVNTRVGEYVSPSSARPPLVIGDTDTLQLRCDIDEQVAPRMRPGVPAVAYLKGDSTRAIDLGFVRIEPYIIPKQSLTGSGTERVDTRVLQVIYRFAKPADRPVYVGQQMDVYIGEKDPAVPPAKK